MTSCLTGLDRFRVDHLASQGSLTYDEKHDHDGDLKAGNGPTGNPPSVNCDDALYSTALGWFKLARRAGDVHPRRQ